MWSSGHARGVRYLSVHAPPPSTPHTTPWVVQQPVSKWTQNVAQKPLLPSTSTTWNKGNGRSNSGSTQRWGQQAHGRQQATWCHRQVRAPISRPMFVDVLSSSGIVTLARQVHGSYECLWLFPPSPVKPECRLRESEVLERGSRRRWLVLESEWKIR